MNRYNLSCRYDSRKSFYGKAVVVEYDDISCRRYELYSYDTLVAMVTYDKTLDVIKYKYLGQFSCTTTRHQKEFFMQHGLLYESDLLELFKKGHLERGW